jgi:hypothetical protein
LKETGARPELLPLTADVNVGPKFGIGFCLPKYLTRYGSSVTLAKKNVTGQVHYRIALAPSKIDVRDLAGFIPQIK